MSTSVLLVAGVPLVAHTLQVQVGLGQTHGLTCAVVTNSVLSNTKKPALCWLFCFWSIGFYLGHALWMALHVTVGEYLLVLGLMSDYDARDASL